MERLFGCPNIVDQEVQPWNFWINPFRMLKAVEMTNIEGITKIPKKADLPSLVHRDNRTYFCEGILFIVIFLEVFRFSKDCRFSAYGYFHISAKPRMTQLHRVIILTLFLIFSSSIEDFLFVCIFRKLVIKF